MILSKPIHQTIYAWIYPYNKMNHYPYPFLRLKMLESRQISHRIKEKIDMSLNILKIPISKTHFKMILKANSTGVEIS